jgi:uncharacterized membrane protein
MLIAFPVGLLAMAVIFDALVVLAGVTQLSAASYWMIAAGVVTGLVAAPFGVVDWLSIPSGTRAKRIGAVHGAGNVVVVVLFAASWMLRPDTRELPSASALILSFAGGALALFTAWLGGELVDRLGVGVDDGAHLDAPSSLTRRHARG